MFLIARLIAVLMIVVSATTANAQSIERMAGQMIMVGFTGDDVSDSGFRAVRRQIAQGRIGGVMYLRTNVSGLDTVRAMNRALLAASPWMPPLIAVDQEGGQVRRLTSATGFVDTPSAEAVGRGSVEAAGGRYTELATGLQSLGFTLNFGPVVDLDLNPANPVIGRFQRAFSDDPDRVRRFAEAFVNSHRRAGVITALKHFPGHGSSSGDTHDGFVDVTREWNPVELEPYRAIIADDMADMIMVAHIYNADYVPTDEEALPASLAPEWIEGVLRGELGYDGVVISDDMEMSAVTDHFDLEQTVVRAVMAGNDILLFSNTAAYDPDLGARIHQIMVDQAAADPAFADRIEASYARIAQLKQRLSAGL
ncbi:glycoside hydrolase family 3 protein [Pelagibacterium montanilacus]|uniref:glycoside hydrolase family 3 protein n=1 Tax=Pelagibacterium montanilacus TaxID=2185280 RepID=UPI000F8CFCD8|nr:glycoside hydrolase family 3 N-terminal domain-containing protein [Pelagibacterium montanilacus]